MADFTVYCLEGRSFPISKKEHSRLMGWLNTKKGQARWLDDAGNAIVLDKIVSIEVDEFEISGPRGIDVPVEVATETKVAEPTEGDPSLDIEAMRAKLLDEMMAKSSCKHEDKQIFFIETKSSKGKITKRYFPVCSFCGQRFKFMKASDLTDEQKETAQMWVDTD